MTDIVERLEASESLEYCDHVRLCDEAAAEIRRLREALEDANSKVITFCGVWADRFQRDLGLDGLHPVHYDILEKAGARMDGFKRAALAPVDSGQKETPEP